jgi:DNA-binding MarR family transcriptional regulator
MPIEISRYGKRKPQVLLGLNKMEKQGLLVKARDEQKRNTFRISLTEKLTA